MRSRTLRSGDGTPVGWKRCCASTSRACRARRPGGVAAGSRRPARARAGGRAASASLPRSASPSRHRAAVDDVDGAQPRERRRVALRGAPPARAPRPPVASAPRAAAGQRRARQRARQHGGATGLTRAGLPGRRGGSSAAPRGWPLVAARGRTATDRRGSWTSSGRVPQAAGIRSRRRPLRAVARPGGFQPGGGGQYGAPVRSISSGGSTAPAHRSASGRAPGHRPPIPAREQLEIEALLADAQVEVHDRQQRGLKRRGDRQPDDPRRSR